MLEAGSASDSGSDGAVLGNVAGTRGQVDCWSVCLAVESLYMAISHF